MITTCNGQYVSKTIFEIMMEKRISQIMKYAQGFKFYAETPGKTTSRKLRHNPIRAFDHRGIFVKLSEPCAAKGGRVVG